MASLVWALAFAGGVLVSGNQGFLSQQVSKHDVDQAFLAELNLFDSSRVASLEAELLPLFRSLPKNEHGNLDNPTVRYAIHRYFEHNYGWQVKGLRLQGETWNSSSTTDVMKNRVSTYVLELFEKQLEGKGFNVQNMAIYTAILQDLVHEESTDVLTKLFSLEGIHISEPVGAEQLDKMITVLVAAFTLGEFELNSHDDMDTIERDILETAPRWSNTVMWITDVRLTMEWANVGTRNPFKPHEYRFTDGLDISRHVLRKIAAFEMAECRMVKDVLVDMDPHNVGRVALADYYNNDGIDFHESVGYLRQMGILDESHPNQPTVVIPNLLQSSGNCALVTDYYSVCCIDECEDLMQHLEAQIAAPEATPAKILEVISGLRSDSVDAPRNMSTLLVNRLHEISHIHGGNVKLHGRLFLQWMHHAYPRECVFPHVSGTTKQLQELEWADWAGMDDAMVTPEERSQYNVKDPSFDSLSFEDMVNAMPWSNVEELVTDRKKAAAPSSLFKRIRYVVGLMALVSVVLPLFRSSKQGAWASKSPEAVCV